MQQNYLYSPSSYPYAISNSTVPPSCNNPWSENTVNSTPVSTSLYGTTATSSWAHTVPTLMPWMPENGSADTDPSVVRFSAPVPLDPCTSKTATEWELFNNLGAGKSSANLHLKRRPEAEELELSAEKQFISEEKMAARMREMHISNNYTVPLQNSPFGPYGCDPMKPEKSVKSLKELDNLLPPSDLSKSLALCNRSLVLSPELKSLVEPEKLFANTLLSRIERPSMAVVLWKPPNGCIGDIVNSKCKNDDNPTNESDNYTIAPSVSSSPLPSGLLENNNNNSAFSPDFLNRTQVENVSVPFYPDTSTDVTMEA